MPSTRSDAKPETSAIPRRWTCGLEAVAALVAVEPVLGARVGEHPLHLDASLECEAPGLLHAGLALLARQVPTALAHDLAGAPAAGQSIRGRRRADPLAPVVARGLGTGPVFLAVAVPREDLDQALALRVVLAVAELVVHARAGGGVSAPGQAVRNHQRVEAPLRQLLEQLGRGGGVFAAVGRQVARVDAPLAVGGGGHALEPPQQVRVGVEAEGGDPLQAPQQPAGRGALRDAVGQGCDRTRWQLVVRQAREQHVAVPPVRFGGGPRLRPLPAHEGDEIRARGVARELVALADVLLGPLPALWRDSLGVIVDGEEVEGCAVASEVAGIRGGVSAFSAEDRQRVDEGVDGVRGVDVQVTEQDLLALDAGPAQRDVRVGPRGIGRRDRRVRAGLAFDHTGRQVAVAAADAQGNQRGQGDRPRSAPAVLLALGLPALAPSRCRPVPGHTFSQPSAARPCQRRSATARGGPQALAGKRAPGHGRSGDVGSRPEENAVPPGPLATAFAAVAAIFSRAAKGVPGCAVG
jgi:hypothetical protein